MTYGFGIASKLTLDGIVLESIRFILYIKTVFRYKSKYNYYILDITNSRTIENIIVFFRNSVIGIKSSEYKRFEQEHISKIKIS